MDQLLQRAWLFVFLLLLVPKARADATLFIEEPVNFLGHVTASGHSALFLDNVCSDDHVSVRTCHDGEPGSVISRYTGIGKYDWIAVPPIPYLYAVDSADAIPGSITAAEAGTLRSAYWNGHLRALDPDASEGTWIPLLGEGYRREIIGIRIRTSHEQDLRLIAWLNGTPNRSHFNLVYSNCSDFLRRAINVLYPGAIRRSIVFDSGMTTPKQLASSLHRYGQRHPEVDLRLSVIPQVPGDTPRSGHLYGVAEAFVKTKPYLLPLIIIQPIGIGSVVAVGLSDRRYDIHADAKTAPRLSLFQAPPGSGESATQASPDPSRTEDVARS